MGNDEQGCSGVSASTGAGLEPGDFLLELIDSFFWGEQSKFSNVLVRIRLLLAS
jgi:hypothetical protein